MKNKHLLLYFLLTFFNQIVNAQFTVNGKQPVYDETSNTYIISIPQESFNNDYDAEIILTQDSGWTDLKIDDITITNKFSFNDIKANKNYIISANTHKKEIIETNITFTYLPIVEIKGNIGYDFTTGFMKIHMPNQTSVENIFIKAKWRGGSTNGPERNKRNYKIKTLDSEGNSKDYSFLDMRNDNNWILDAGQVDMFRMRNRIATDLWNDFSKKPYYADKEPNAKSGTNGKIVELIINNEYRGIYALTEVMDRKEMKLKKYNQDGTIHGQLWKTTGYGYATFWEKPDEYDNNCEIWDVFETKYPDIEDIYPTDYSTLYEAIYFVSTSSDKEFTEKVADYFDIPVLIDYYIFLMVINGIDNIGKNMYWAVYDKTTDKKLTPAIWDLDATVGQNYVNTPLHPDYVKYDNPLNINGINIFYRLNRLNVENFNNKLKERYFYLRQNKLEEKYIIQLYEYYYYLIKNCGAATREEIKYSYDTDLGKNELNFDKELIYIKDWIKNRLTVTDNYFSQLCSETAISPIDYNTNTKTNYDLFGRNVNLNGIYILNGKKYIKRKNNFH